MAARGFRGETAAELGVGGDSPADEQAAGSKVFDGGERGAGQIVGDCGLEAGDEVEGFGVEVGERRSQGFGVGGLRVDEVFGSEGRGAGFDSSAHVVELGVAADGGFDAAEGEVEARGVVAGCQRCFSGELGCGIARGLGLDLGEGEGDGLGVAVGRERVHPRAAGIG